MGKPLQPGPWESPGVQVQLEGGSTLLPCLGDHTFALFKGNFKL